MAGTSCQDHALRRDRRAAVCDSRPRRSRWWLSRPSRPSRPRLAPCRARRFTSPRRSGSWSPRPSFRTGAGVTSLARPTFRELMARFPAASAQSSGRRKSLGLRCRVARDRRGGAQHAVARGRPGPLARGGRRPGALVSSRHRPARPARTTSSSRSPGDGAVYSGGSSAPGLTSLCRHQRQSPDSRGGSIAMRRGCRVNPQVATASGP
jgi:hypothetical protein